MTTFKLTANFEPAIRKADRLDEIARGAQLLVSAVDAVNDVARRVDAAARRAMNAGLNLSDDYVARKMQVFKATVQSRGVARAEIIARGDLTVLSHFPYAQLSEPARGRARGDPKRGIPPGRRPAGVAVEIRRGDAKAVPGWFTMTLRRGTAAGDKVGVFYRHSDGRIEHKYGPSPYSLFRFQVNQHIDEIEADLRETAAAGAAKILQKAAT